MISVDSCMFQSGDSANRTWTLLGAGRAQVGRGNRSEMELSTYSNRMIDVRCLLNGVRRWTERGTGAAAISNECSKQRESWRAASENESSTERKASQTEREANRDGKAMQQARIDFCPQPNGTEQSREWKGIGGDGKGDGRPKKQWHMRRAEPSLLCFGCSSDFYKHTP